MRFLNEQLKTTSIRDKKENKVVIGRWVGRGSDSAESNICCIRFKAFKTIPPSVYLPQVKAYCSFVLQMWVDFWRNISKQVMLSVFREVTKLWLDFYVTLERIWWGKQDQDKIKTVSRALVDIRLQSRHQPSFAFTKTIDDMKLNVPTSV